MLVVGEDRSTGATGCSVQLPEPYRDFRNYLTNGNFRTGLLCRNQETQRDTVPLSDEHVLDMDDIQPQFP
jgi:hypothetical protein